MASGSLKMDSRYCRKPRLNTLPVSLSNATPARASSISSSRNRSSKMIVDAIAKAEAACDREEMRFATLQLHQQRSVNTATSDRYHQRARTHTHTHTHTHTPPPPPQPPQPPQPQPPQPPPQPPQPPQPPTPIPPPTSPADSCRCGKNSFCFMIASTTAQGPPHRFSSSSRSAAREGKSSSRSLTSVTPLFSSNTANVRRNADHAASLECAGRCSRIRAQSSLRHTASRWTHSIREHVA